MKKKFTILIAAALMLLTMMARPVTAWGQSDYSTDYTGNITLSTTGGTQASACVVKINNTDYDGIKAGTSKNAGAVKITVPSGTKYLHLHLAAWNNETVTLTVTPTGYSGNIALTNNSGISNNSPFTFNGDPSTSDYYKVITFTSALTANTDLTFTATGGKRFVVWGVTSEEEGSGDDPSISADDVELAYDDTWGEIEYTINNPATSGNLTAEVTAGDWLENLQVGETVTFNCDPNSNAIARTATVKLTYTYSAKTTVTKNVTVTQAGNPDGPGSANNPYTVAQAIAAIDAGTGITNVYATGIISQVDSYNSNYFSITYWISSDGTTASDQLEVYSGKGLDNTNFSSINDVEVGATVVVYGTLKKYGEVYEFDKNNYLTSYTAPTHDVEAPTFSPAAGTYAEAQTVTMSCTTDGAAIHYTTDGTEPDGNSNVYTTGIEVSETTTFKAKAIKGNDASNVVTATYHICSAENPYTVAQALAFLEYPTSTIWVHGIVSTAPTAAPNNGQLTYYISDNGEATNQLQVYKGKGLNNAAFTAQDDIQVGDIVTITGTVKIYNTTTEFDAGNYLTSFERPVEPSITVANSTVNVGAEGGEGTLTVTYENITEIAADVWFCNAAGTEEATYDWITASINNSTNNADYLVEPNDGNERTAYFKVWAYDDEMNEVYSNLVTVTQAEYVAPTPSIAVDPTLVEAPAAGANGTITVTLTAIYNNEIEVQWFESDGTTTATYDWIEATVDPNNDIAYVIGENTGDARSAYFKVYGIDSEANDVYSELVTINQAGGTTPPTPSQYDWIATTLANLTSDDVFVIVGDNGDTYAMANNNGTGSAPKVVKVTVSNNALSGNIGDTIQWNLSISDDGYTFYPNGTTETWLYCTNTNNGVRVGTNAAKVFVIDGGYLKHVGTSRYVGIYNSQDWRCYTSNTGTSNIADQTFAFYKRVPASTEPSITLNQYTYNLNADDGDTELPVTTANLSATPNLAVVFYESDGVTPATYDWITATINNAGNIAGHIDENEGAARTAYFKVSGLANDNTTTVYSDLVTINQAAATAPSIVFETASMDLVAGGEQDRKISFDYSGLGSTPTFTINYYESDGTTAATYNHDWLTATIEGDKVNITAIANTGEARHVYFKVYGEKNANVHAESNLVTVNQAEYVAPTYTVTYVANGGTGTMTDPNSPYTENTEVTLLENTFTAPEGKIWDSWLIQDANQATISVNGGKFTMPASNVTVTAQWIDDPSAPTYEWVLTALEDLTSSDVFVIVGNNGSNYAMTNNNGTTSAPSASAVTVANNKLSNAPDDNLKWNIEISNNGYTFYPNGVTNKWLYCTDANNGLRVGTGDNKVFAYEEVTTTDKEGYYLTITPASDKRYVCIYNNADWRSYKSSSIVKTDTKFYKRQVASTDPQLSANDVDIASDATEGEITYTLENEVTGGALTAEITAGNEGNWLTLGTVGTTVPFTCSPNTEATERTATVTLTYTYNAKATVTATVVVTQAALVIDFATMPFEFNGGRNDIENIVGLTQENLGTDYNNSSTTKLKFDNKNNNSTLVLKLNAAPVSISYDIIGNGFSGSTFKVQVSADGTDYDDLATYTELAATTQTITLINNDDNARFVRWIYFKNSGNVGLGNIHVTDHYDTYGDVTLNNIDLTSSSESLIVHEGSVVTISGDLINNSPDNLVIEDGGQLIHDNAGVKATIKKNITGYGTGEGNYYFLVSPFTEDIDPEGVNSMIATPAENYDLYQWNSSEADEWRNYKQGTFNLVHGNAYLYANKNDVELVITGTLLNSNEVVEKDMVYNDADFGNWNLVGNPFACNAYVTLSTATEPMAYYRMNLTGTNFEASTAPITPMEGIFVKATEEGQKCTFSRTAPQQSQGKGNLNIQVAQVVNTRGAQPTSDNAIIRFDGGNTLEKFSFRDDRAKLYIPQGKRDYAVVNAEAQGETPLYFKAVENGTYTIDFSKENVEFSYLHLIDNLTGVDIDLLQNPSYSFEANNKDYPSRFRLMFKADSINANGNENDNFGFISNGNLMILGIDGEATLQVIDITGRILSSETFSGSYNKAVNGVAGVYMIRLIQGENVRTQKIVVK